MATLFDPNFQASDANGLPLSGAKLNFYQTGTSTRVSIYQDKNASTPHANPVVADSSGRFAPIYINTYPLKVVLTTAAGVVVRTIDPAASQVPTAMLENLAVTTAKIANLAVTSGKIAAGAVTFAKLGTDAVNLITTNGGLIYDTKSSLEADLVPAANASAWVIDDGTVANNGIYRKSGGSGAGSWSKVADLPYSFIKATDAGAGTPDAIVATTDIPVSESALIWTNVFEANTDAAPTISFNGGSPLTIKRQRGGDFLTGELPPFLLGFISGSTFQSVFDVPDEATLAAIEAIANDFGDLDAAMAAINAARDKAEEWAEAAEDVEVETGQYSAKHHAIKSALSEAGALAGEAGSEAAQALAETARDAALAATLIYADTTAGLAAVANGAYFYVPSADADESLILYRDVAGVATEIKRYPSSAAIPDLVEKTDALMGIETIGRPVASPPVTGSALTTNTYIFAAPATESGVIETVRLWGLSAGTVKLRVFDRSGDTFTQSGADANLTVSSGAALKTISTLLAVSAGQYVGFYAPTNVMTRSSATVDSGGWYTPSVAADSTSFTDATPSTNLRLEIGVDITYQHVTTERLLNDAQNIATLQDTAEDHEGRLAVLDHGVVEQIIGKQSDPVNTGVSASAGTYVIADPVIGDGRIIAVKLWPVGTGTLALKVFDEADGTLTQSGSDLTFAVTAGVLLSVVDLNVPVLKGQRVGFYASAAFSRVVAAGHSGGYDSLGASNLTTGAAAAVPNVANQFEFSVTLEVVRPDRWTINLRNSDRIICLGDSFTEGPYTQRGKNWLAKVSEFTDWTFDNFAKSGETAAENLTRLRANTATLGILPYRDRSATYALIYVGQNDAVATTLADFIEDMRQLIETVKGLGAIPILVAPHSLDAALYGQGFSLIYRNLAEEHGCLFVDVAEWARVNDYGTRYAGFWNGTHPGVRTNQLQVAPVERLLEAIEAPRQSLKLFRKRSGVSVSTVADLLFNSPFERAKLFKEILVGTGALKVANENIYDEANTIDAAEIELLASEYEALQIGDTIALDDYSLIEVTLPTTAKHIDQLKLALNETAATVYCRNVFGGSVSNGVPIGGWVALNGGGGVYRLSNSELKRFMRQDKVSFLVYKSGGIAALAEPRVEWIGALVPKPRKVGKTQGRRAVGTELLTNTDLGVSTGWTDTGSVGRGAPSDSCLPLGSTGRVTVTSSIYTTTTFTFAADTRQSREIEIRVSARVFPTIFASGGTYPSGAGITQDSFDWGLAQIEVAAAAGQAQYREKVGLWWGDIILRTIVPLGVSSLTLRVRAASGSHALEVARASARLVDG